MSSWPYFYTYTIISQLKLLFHTFCDFCYIFLYLEEDLIYKAVKGQITQKSNGLYSYASFIHRRKAPILLTNPYIKLIIKREKTYNKNNKQN